MQNHDAIATSKVLGIYVYKFPSPGILKSTHKEILVYTLFTVSFILFLDAFIPYYYVWFLLAIVNNSKINSKNVIFCFLFVVFCFVIWIKKKHI